ELPVVKEPPADATAVPEAPQNLKTEADPKKLVPPVPLGSPTPSAKPAPGALEDSKLEDGKKP
ncbi:MAG: hypothetical protein ABI992_12050, partial [Chthoniobacterales bacterium]